MKDFNWEEFKKGNIVVHCDTKEKSDNFIELCEKQSIKVDNVRKFSNYYRCDNDYNNWYRCDNKKLYHSTLKFYTDMGYKIIKWQIDDEKQLKVYNIMDLVQNEGKEFVNSEIDKQNIIYKYKNGKVLFKNINFDRYFEETQLKYPKLLKLSFYAKDEWDKVKEQNSKKNIKIYTVKISDTKNIKCILHNSKNKDINIFDIVSFYKINNYNLLGYGKVIDIKKEKLTQKEIDEIEYEIFLCGTKNNYNTIQQQADEINKLNIKISELEKDRDNYKKSYKDLLDRTSKKIDEDIDKDDFDNSCSKKLDEILNKDEDNNHLGFKNSPLNFYYNITNDNGELNTECKLNGEDIKLDDLEKVLKGYLR